MAIDEKGVSFIKGSTDLGSSMSDLQQFSTLLFHITDLLLGIKGYQGPMKRVLFKNTTFDIPG